ncbi:hypothetical protein NIES4101_62990 [Calothrix sp. NIES-4101]|nr:hypothetical protein NIES4101_62990 [Calothrix sp. NIES-4101]
MFSSTKVELTYRMNRHLSGYILINSIATIFVSIIHQIANIFDIPKLTVIAVSPKKVKIFVTRTFPIQIYFQSRIQSSK